MATITTAVSTDWSTDAGYRAAVAAISANFDTMGWARTSDTGQLDTTTVVRPSIGSAANYEVRKSNDGLTDIYMKIGYSISNTNAPYLIVTWGDSSDGAGTIKALGGTTNVIAINSATNSSFSITAGTFNCYFCYETSGGSFVVAFFAGSTGPFAMTTERSRNNSGGATSDYFTAHLTQAQNITSNRNTQQSFVFGVGKGPATSALNCALPTAASLAFNGDIGVSPVFPAIPYVGNPMLMIQVVKTADVSSLATYSSTIYGASHTYMAVYGANLSTVGPYTMTGTGFAMRWE